MLIRKNSRRSTPHLIWFADEPNSTHTNQMPQAAAALSRTRPPNSLIQIKNGAIKAPFPVPGPAGQPSDSVAIQPLALRQHAAVDTDFRNIAGEQIAGGPVPAVDPDGPGLSRLHQQALLRVDAGPHYQRAIHIHLHPLAIVHQRNVVPVLIGHFPGPVVLALAVL